MNGNNFSIFLLQLWSQLWFHWLLFTQTVGWRWLFDFFVTALISTLISLISFHPDCGLAITFWFFCYNFDFIDFLPPRLWMACRTLICQQTPAAQVSFASTLTRFQGVTDTLTPWQPTRVCQNHLDKVSRYLLLLDTFSTYIEVLHVCVRIRHSVGFSQKTFFFRVIAKIGAHKYPFL